MMIDGNSVAPSMLLIVFGLEDLERVMFPHNNALVIRVVITYYEVARMSMEAYH